MSAALAPASLPPEIEAALRARFGGTAVEDLRQVAGGASGLVVVSFAVAGKAYVAKAGSFDGTPHGIACLRIAAARGLAPEVAHADERTGVVIMAHGGPPFRRDPTRLPAQLAAIASVLRRLHEGPAFAPRDAFIGRIGDIEAEMIARTGEGMPSPVHRLLANLAPYLARYGAEAPCHRDLHMNNVLEQGGRILLVDWDTAGPGDPYVDLAQLGVFALPSPELRRALLEAYLERPPTAVDEARSAVARVVALTAYAGAFFSVHARSGRRRAEEEARPRAEEIARLGRPGGFDAEKLGASLLRQAQEEVEGGAFREGRRVLGV